MAAPVVVTSVAVVDAAGAVLVESKDVVAAPVSEVHAATPKMATPAVPTPTVRMKRLREKL